MARLDLDLVTEVQILTFILQLSRNVRVFRNNLRDPEGVCCAPSQAPVPDHPGLMLPRQYRLSLMPQALLEVEMDSGTIVSSLLCHKNREENPE